jgi:hypothetical protein
MGDRLRRVHTPNVPLPADLRVMPLWHGTRFDAAGQAILRAQALLPATKRSRVHTAPREGRLYVASVIERALEYVYWCSFPCSMATLHRRGGDRYGWLFAVDPDALYDVDPDEDDVGAVVGSCLEFAQARGRLTAEGETCRELGRLAVARVAGSRLDRLNELQYQASVGKQLLPHLSDRLKQYVIAAAMQSAGGASLSIEHAVPITGAWRVDRQHYVESAEEALEHAARIL